MSPSLDSTNMQCLSEDMLLLFHHGRLPDDSLESYAEHLSTCPHCDARLTALEAIPDQLEAALRRGRSGTPLLAAGTMLGEYELLELIGRGGMAKVWKARHRRMNRTVAIKVMAGDLRNAASFSERFQREVEVLANLKHPNIAVAYDAGEHHGCPYLVMEYLEGTDLAKRIVSGPLSVVEARDAVLQAARGLAYAHQRGLVHRDVKPGNLFRLNDGTLKVLDLGLVRREEDVTPPAAHEVTASGNRETILTSATTIMGTLDYAAPEQIASAASADAKADVYSLGCTWYALLTGRSPFARATAEATLQAHRVEAPLKLEGVPSRMAALAARLVSKAPAERPTMAELVAALEPKAKSTRWLVAAAVFALVALLGFMLARPPRPAGLESPAHVASSVPAPSSAAPPVRKLPAMLGTTLTAKEAQEFQFRWASEAGVPVVEINQLEQSMMLIPPGVIADLKLSMIQPLWVCETETSVREFRAFVNATGYVPECSRAAGGGRLPLLKMGMLGKAFEASKSFTWDQPGFPRGYEANNPVVQVSWHDAAAFCEWLSAKEQCRYRLPTWDEHRWFSRCGIATQYHFGNDWKDGLPYENIFLTQQAPGLAKSQKPNPWGLCNTLGNVKEWTADWSTTAQKSRKVASGSYVESFEEITKWSDWDPHVGAGHIGFRVVKEFTAP